MESYRPYGTPAPAPRARFPWIPLLLLAVVVFLVFRELNWGPRLLDPDAEPRAVTPRGELADFEQSTIRIFEENKASVVQIYTSQYVQRRNRFGFAVGGLSEVPKGSGSGFVWSEDGYIVTNYHVVEDSDNLKVRLRDGSEVDGAYVGGDQRFDLAVVKIDARGQELRPVLVGSSSDLHTGQAVYAIGNPFEFGWTLTTGVVSGLDRVITSVARTPIQGVIQTDAAINPGNSGGPLLDSAGRLIGINTAIYSEGGGSDGIGFAVPVDIVNQIVPNLIARGRVARPGLGVFLFPDEIVEEAGLDGAVVHSVMPGGPADRAGIRSYDDRRKSHDTIVAIDDQAVRRGSELQQVLDAYEIGDEVELRIRRDEQEYRTTLVLKEVR